MFQQKDKNQKQIHQKSHENTEKTLSSTNHL